jgi:hypothetical protein
MRNQENTGTDTGMSVDSLGTVGRSKGASTINTNSITNNNTFNTSQAVNDYSSNSSNDNSTISTPVKTLELSTTTKNQNNTYTNRTKNNFETNTADASPRTVFQRYYFNNFSVI